jgi:SET domain-containing protein
MFFYKSEVKVATNPKMGLGLFAKEFIPKNSITWKFVEGVDTKISLKQFDELNDAQKEYFTKYGWIEKGEEGFYYSSGDLSNFMNHSYTPNLDGKQECLIAVRDIQVGEELFVDYSEFCANFDEDEVKE